MLNEVYSLLYSTFEDLQYMFSGGTIRIINVLSQKYTLAKKLVENLYAYGIPLCAYTPR